MSDVFTSIDDTSVKQGSIVSIEVMKQIAQNLSYLIDSMPIGSFIFSTYGMPGFGAVTQPDTNLWKLCDGSTISDTDSPLFGQAVPDFATAPQGVYIKMQTDSSVGDMTGVAGQLGSNSKNLTHNHGGITSTYAHFNGGQYDSVTAPQADFDTPSHAHSLSASDGIGTVSLQPKYIAMRMYIKVK